jgi:hypothetical protein
MLMKIGDNNGTLEFKYFQITIRYVYIMTQAQARVICNEAYPIQYEMRMPTKLLEPAYIWRRIIETRTCNHKLEKANYSASDFGWS